MKRRGKLLEALKLDILRWNGKVKGLDIKDPDLSSGSDTDQVWQKPSHFPSLICKRKRGNPSQRAVSSVSPLPF